MSEILCVANGKGGVGKTTTSFALASAAALRGSTLVVDLDPTASLTSQLQLPGNCPGIAEALRGERDSLSSILLPGGGAPPGIGNAWWTPEKRLYALPGNQSLYHQSIGIDALRDALSDSLQVFEYVIIDTRPSLDALVAPMSLANRVLFPSPLDLVSFPITADAVALADAAGVLNRAIGVLGTRVRRPMNRIARGLYKGLQQSGAGLESVLWETVGWQEALGAGSLDGYPALRAIADAILTEALARPAATLALRRYAKYLSREN